ncbi:hypothetical protein [Fervidobacterium thailandense]|uniref:Uncharacterized protein n=1 Tax=Fervidobacterium thailandense TaxID=1008305 RepID=A0A1E3G3Z9_9BACT|nr:hypothetical protein [Fervidobacterium thailandense]ODN30902.1 hypothetical protein A4H02_03305 [Fervidobacterium thailandense]
MIGYLAVTKIDNKHLGGFLVVNDIGIPVEFKYSEPVTPTRLQEIIYGSSLEYYLHVEIIAKGLIQKSESRPEVILVQDPNLLFDKNIVYVSALPQGVAEKREASEAIINLSGMSLKLMVSENFKLDDTVIEKIRELSSKIDILEPFDRIERALEYVCESQEK